MQVKSIAECSKGICMWIQPPALWHWLHDNVTDEDSQILSQDSEASASPSKKLESLIHFFSFSNISPVKHLHSIFESSSEKAKKH